MTDLQTADLLVRPIEKCARCGAFTTDYELQGSGNPDRETGYVDLEPVCGDCATGLDHALAEIERAADRGAYRRGAAALSFAALVAAVGCGLLLSCALEVLRGA